MNNSDVKNSGEITISLWKLLLPREPVPSVSQRAFVLVMSHEGTDYDEIEWNYGTADDKSGLTWGPFGATVGYGNEVRGILQLLDDNVLRTVFASDYSIIHRLLNSKPKDGYVVLKPVYLNDRHRERFGDAFVRLASIPSTRNAYDQHAYVSSDWFRPALGMLEELVSDSGADQSETDFAFFLDLAVHARVDKERLKTTLRAILNEEAKLGRKLSFGERRRLIGNSFAGFVNPRRKEDRIGRNVVYYVDAIGEANLSDLELRSWRMRTNRKASHVGLTDCSYSTDLE